MRSTAARSSSMASMFRGSIECRMTESPFQMINGL
jgi:hypothetical protein